MKHSIILFFIVLLLSLAKIQAQCPPSYGDDTWPDVPITAYMAVNDFDILFTLGWVDYKSKGSLTGNSYDIVVDWSTWYKAWDGKVSEEEYKSWMRLAVIRSILLTSFSDNNSCNFIGTKQFTFYEEVSCQAKSVCYFRLKQSSWIYCRDDGFPGPDPTLIDDGVWRYFGRLTGFIDCGTKSCCQIVYTMECVNGTLSIVGGAPVKSMLPGSECPQGTNVNCFGTPEPCTSTCN